VAEEMAAAMGLESNDERAKAAASSMMETLVNCGVVEMDKGHYLAECRRFDVCPKCGGQGTQGGWNGQILWEALCNVCGGTGRYWPTQER
jgi:DnaJ-class molecular chaperone